MYRFGMFKILIVGLLIGILAAPALWFGAANITSAQSLPFTPTPEPTATATVAPSATASVEPTSTTEAATQPPVVIVATPTPQSATATPSPTALPPGYGRDRCDPNHTLQQPCALATETDITNLNFTDNTVDVFSFLLKGNRQYRISAMVDASGGIDPAMEVFLAGATDTAIGANDDIAIGNPSAAMTVTVTADAWYLVRVTNKAPGKAEGHTYTLSARSVAAANDTTTPTASNPDDLIGNAYDVAHAVRLAWNVPYDLSMICPDARPNACYAGRHTFLFVPVKQGIPLTALTYDLGVGVDTVLTLYRPDANQVQDGPGFVPGWSLMATNDDIAPGWTLRSQIAVVPEWNGMALLVVAPSDREDLPPMPADGRPGRYRLSVGSPELPNVKAALTAANVDQPPTAEPPTPRPTSQPAPAAISTAPAQDTREVIKEACPTGQAVVGTESTGLYAAAPPGSDDRIAAYPDGALVKLLGQCYRGWVKVQPADSVTPGWMWGPDLRPDELSAAPGVTVEANSTSGGASSTTRPTDAGESATNPRATTPTPLVSSVALTPLEPVDLPIAPTAKPSARAVTVEVCRATKQGSGCGAPIANMRVEIVLAATHQILSSSLTDTSGTVTLSVSVPEGSQLLLSVPALGIEQLLGANETNVPVRIAAEGGQ